MKTKTAKKLTRSNNRMVAGVLGGIADYFNWNATYVRIAFVVLTLFSHGLGVILYLLLMTIIPNSPDHLSFFDMLRKQAFGDGAGPAQANKGRKIIRNVHEEDNPYQRK